MNETRISDKDVRKIVRARALMDQILSALPPELARIGFDGESGRRAVTARWARRRANNAAGHGGNLRPGLQP